MNTLGAVVMAGGKGTRMNSGIPKVLHRLAERPIILYTIELLKQIPIATVVVVIGYKAKEVMQVVGTDVLYARQEEPEGTAHALQTALSVMPKAVTTILSVYGDDSAFYRPETLRDYIGSFIRSGADMACLTVVRDDPTGLGRIIRGEGNRIVGIVEEKLASEEQKRINEINTGAYLFKRGLLENTLPAIQRNPTGEYFLTDIVQLAIDRGFRVVAYRLPHTDEWVGVNTPEQLAAANDLMQKRLRQEL